MHDDVHVGDDGWLYLVGGSNEVLRFFQEPLFFEQAKDTWLDRLRTRVSEAGKRGAMYRHLVVPDKIAIYPEYCRLSLQHAASAPSRALLACARSADPAISAALVDVYTAMIAHKAPDRKLFFKTDTHWTFEGAWAAYRALCESLGVSPNFGILEAPVGTAQLILDLGGKLQPPVSETYEVKQFATHATRTFANVLVAYKEANEGHDLGGLHVGSHIVLKNDTPGIDPRRIALFGDSFSEYRLHMLTGLLSETFAETHFIWSGAIDWDYVDRVAPDIVVTEQAERFHNLVPDDTLDIEAFAQERLAKHLAG